MRYFLIPVLLGAFSVLQATFNRRIGLSWGLAGAVLFNALVLTVAATAFYFGSQRGMSDAWRGRWGDTPFQLWYVLPGLFGFCLVAGIPWAIARLGALEVFLSLIAAQITVSLLWDWLSGGMPITAFRLGGAVLVVSGAYLATRTAT